MSISKVIPPVHHFSNDSKLRLYIFIKTLQSKDSSPLRQAIYRQYILSKVHIKLLQKLYKISPTILKAIYLFLYAALCLGKIPNTRKSTFDINCFWENPSELKSIIELIQESNFQCVQVSFKFQNFIRNLLLVNICDMYRLWKFVRFLSQKYPLLLAGRTSELLVFSFLFSKSKDKYDGNFFVSSDASPTSLSLFYLLKNKQIIYYVPHGIIPDSKHLILFQKAYYKCLYNFNLMSKRSAGHSYLISNKVFRKINIPQNYQKVGIVCSIIPNIQKINQLAFDLETDGYEVLAKLHPNQISKQKLNKSISLVKDFDDCDVVICGNSGHAIELLLKSIPVLYCADLDYAPYDVYSLIRNKILPEYNEAKKFEDISCHYNNKDWEKKWMNI